MVRPSYFAKIHHRWRGEEGGELGAANQRSEIRERKSEVGGSTEKLSQRHSEKLKTSDARELFATANPSSGGSVNCYRLSGKPPSLNLLKLLAS